MSNYKQTVVSGEKYIRANRVVLENPLNGIPSALFIEEEIINIGGEIIRRPISTLSEQMLDPTTSFNLINPVDDSIIGTSDYQSIYVLLYSFHRHLAAIRDAGTV